MENEAQLAQQLIDQLNEQDRGTAFNPPKLIAKINKDRWWITAQGSIEPVAKLDVLEGQVLAAKIWRAMYASRGGEVKAPDCFSADGRRGQLSVEAANIGIDNGQLCAACPFDQWGSGKDELGNPDKGKACKEKRDLLMLLPNFETPVIVQLPTSSIRAWDTYAGALANQRPASSYIAHMTQISIEVVHKNSREWGVAVFKAVGKLDAAQTMEALSARREAFPLFQGAPLLEEVAPSTLLDNTESPF